MRWLAHPFRGPLGLARLHARLRRASHHLRIRGRRLVEARMGRLARLSPLALEALERLRRLLEAPEPPLCERRNPRGRSGEPAPSGHHHDRNGRHDPPRLLGPLQHRALGLGPQAPRHRLRARRAPAQEGRDRRARRPRGRTRAPLPRRAPPPHQRRRLLHLLLARGLGPTHVQFFEGFNYSPMLTLDMPGTHAGSVCAVALVVFPHASLPALAPAQPRRTPHAVRRGPARRAHRGTRPDDQRPREAAQGHDDISLPSLVYSLFHYKRPHPGMRVANLLRLKRLSAPGSRLEHLFPKPAEPRAPEAD